VSNIVLSCDPSNYSILSFSFPTSITLRSPFPSFPPANPVIITIGKVINYSNKTVINVIPGAKLKIDSKSGYLSFLEEHKKLRITKKLQAFVNDLPISDFWPLAKIASITGKFPILPSSSKATIYNLFCNLFGGYDVKYRIYRQLDIPRNVIFSSLLSMMMKVKILRQRRELPGISISYKKALMGSIPFYGNYCHAVDEYLISNKSEEDFLYFLLNCNKIIRNGGRR